MPRVNVPVTVIGRKGTTPATPPAATVGDPVNNHSIANDGNMWFEAKNTGATPRTVTVTPTATVDGMTATATPITIAAGATIRRGGYPVDIYGPDLQVDVAHAEVTLTAWTLAT